MSWVRKVWIGGFFGFFVFFHAGAMASVQPLEFNQALSLIVARSTAVFAQQAVLQARVASDLPARLFYLPSFDVTAKRALVGSEFDSNTFGNELSLNANLNLFRFGGDLAAWSAAHSDESAERAQLLNETLKAEQEAVESLVALISAFQELEVSRKSLRLQEELVRVGRIRYDRGLLSLQELDKLTIDLENIRSSVADSEVQSANTTAHLNALLGDASVAPVWPWKKVEIKIQAGIENRPDLQTATARSEAESARYRQKVAAALPTLDLNSTYGYSSGALMAAREDGKSWTGAIALSIPLFDRLSRYSDARAQAFNREAAEVRLEQARRAATEDLEAARASFTISRQSMIAREKALTVSGKIYGDSLKRFQSGRLDANALTVDQARVLSSELNAVHGWAVFHTTASRLCHAQGLRLGDCLHASE